MASSEKLSILELTILGHGAGAMLGYLHLPHLKVLSVRYFLPRGQEIARVASEFIGDRSRHALQVLILDNISLDALEDLVLAQGLSRIPIVEFRLLTPESHEIEINECVTVLPERLKKWEVEVDSRLRICAILNSDYLIFAVGWVDLRWYEQHQQSIPCDILDSVHIDRLLAW